MKLSGPAALRFVARPEGDRPAMLLYGSDPMRVALKRQEAVAAIAGPKGDEDMRITRLAAGDIRRDPAILPDAVRARSFFPGPRVVSIEDAGDGLTGELSALLPGWTPEDAQIVVAAGQLAKSSSLRKLFESHPTAVAIAIYDDPPGRPEVEAMLSAAGLRMADAAAMDDIVALSQALDPGDFRQTVEKLSVYQIGAGPATSADIAAIAPLAVETELDEIFNATAEGRDADLCAALRGVAGKSGDLGRLATLANQHFRALLVVRSDTGGVDAGIGKLRPPVFGARRDRMVRQARTATVAALSAAIEALTDTELALRSSSRAPDFAVVERTLIRIARRMRDEGARAGRR